MCVVTETIFNFGRKQLTEEDYVSVGHCECIKLLLMLHLWSVKIIPALHYNMSVRKYADIMEKMSSLQRDM